jgi:STE24 endopeptidase
MGVQFNYLMVFFLLIYLVPLRVSLHLSKLNRRHLVRNAESPPEAFRGFIDEDKLQRIADYNLEASRFGDFREMVSELLLLAVLASGLLGRLAAGTDSLAADPLLEGLLFYLPLGAAAWLLSLPFDYYATFGIEQKYGFNRSTPGLWIADQVKGAALSAVLAGVILTAVLWFLNRYPQTWWIWAFAAVSAFQIVMVLLYPVLIAPLFNLFEPLRDEELRRKVEELMDQGGVRVKDVLQMDGSRRSSHSNAYFTGFGRTKRIVLFDTLLESHPHDEILAILGHELAHYRKKHILKQVALIEALLLAGFFFTYLLLGWTSLYETFGFHPDMPYAGLLLVGILWGKLSFFFSPLPAALSRRYERQADRFAARLLGAGAPLARALKRIAADNLSNLTPHPLYTMFYASHPPLPERVAALEERGDGAGTAETGRAY